MKFYLLLIGILWMTNLTFAQRIGTECRKELPDTVYLVLADQERAEHVALLYNEFKYTKMNLKALSVDEFVDSVKNDELAFVLPMNGAGDAQGLFFLRLVYGSKKSHLTGIGEEGMFETDWKLGMAVEVSARKQWLESDAVLFYISALEKLRDSAQQQTEMTIKKNLLKGYENDRLERLCFLSENITPLYNKPPKFKQFVINGILLSDMEEFLTTEDIFNPKTTIFTILKTDKATFRFMYSMTFGIVYMEQLDVESPIELDGDQLHQYLKAGKS